jgi:hypothetical protein
MALAIAPIMGAYVVFCSHNASGDHAENNIIFAFFAIVSALAMRAATSRLLRRAIVACKD